MEVLLQTFESDYEVYWVAKEFYAFTVEIQNDFPKLKELTFNLLEKEDAELYSWVHAKHHLNFQIEMVKTRLFPDI